MKPNLNNCPECGVDITDESHIDDALYPITRNRDTWSAGCCECQLFVDVVGSEQDAIEYWNRYTVQYKEVKLARKNILFFLVPIIVLVVGGYFLIGE